MQWRILNLLPMSRAYSNNLLFPIALLSLVMVVIGCSRKEQTSWLTQAVFPVAYGSFGLETLMPDSLVQADDDNLLHLIIEENLTDFDLDSLVKIPDTTAVKSFVVDIAPLSSLPVNPGVSVPFPNEDFVLETDLAELREIVIKSGSIEYEVQNFIGGQLAVTFDMPGVTLNGESFAIEEIIPAGAGGAPSSLGGALDLAGYHFDLTGGTGSGFNVLESNLTVEVDPSSTEAVTVFDQDSIAISISFVEPVVSYARGYFGQHEYTISDPVDFGGFGGVSATSLDIEEIDFSLEIENHVGMDAQIQINKLKAINFSNLQAVELENEQIGESINITRAQDFSGTVSPTTAIFSMDETTSNIDEFIEVVPELLDMDVDVIINPLGDISGGNDFIYTDQALNAILKADIPLCLSVENLTLTDTLDIGIDEVLDANGELSVYITNHLPFGAELEMSIIDGAGVVVAQVIDLGTINSAIENGAEWTPTETVIVAELGRNEMNLLISENQLLLELTFNSSGTDLVKLRGDQILDVKVIANIEGVVGYN